MCCQSRMSVVCRLVCLSCLSVTLVYCSQTVGRIKMKLASTYRLCRSHVLDRDPSPKRGTAPNFRPMSVVAKRLRATLEFFKIILFLKHGTTV